MHAPSLADPAIRQSLAERSAPYWNILEYCRHIGIEKRQKRPTYWLAVNRHPKGTPYRRAKGTPLRWGSWPDAA